jgi:hypothetical protein
VEVYVGIVYRHLKGILRPRKGPDVEGHSDALSAGGRGERSWRQCRRFPAGAARGSGGGGCGVKIVVYAIKVVVQGGNDALWRRV